MWHNQSKTDDCKPSSLEWSKRSPVCLAQLPLFNIAQANGLCKNCPCPINSIDASLLRLFAFRHHEFSVQFPVTCSLWFLCFSAFVYCTPGDMEIAVWKLPRPSKFKNLSGNFTQTSLCREPRLKWVDISVRAWGCLNRGACHNAITRRQINLQKYVISL